MRTNKLTLHVCRQKDHNVFCPRCGIVIPPETKSIASPTHAGVHYHPRCLYSVAEQVGIRIQWA